MNNNSLRYKTLSHAQLLEAVNTDIQKTCTELELVCGSAPIVVRIDAVFTASRESREKFKFVRQLFEDTYWRIVKKHVNNYSRDSKRAFFPRAWCFFDTPTSKLFKPTAATIDQGTPHIHAIAIIHPHVVEKFLSAIESIETEFPSWNILNQSIKIEVARDLERSIAYDAKALQHVQMSHSGEDLFFMLPWGSS